jgi:hypothetical protein
VKGKNCVYYSFVFTVLHKHEFGRRLAISKLMKKNISDGVCKLNEIRVHRSGVMSSYE